MKDVDIGESLDIWGINSSKTGSNQNQVVFETTAQEIHLHMLGVSRDKCLQIKETYGSLVDINVKIKIDRSDLSKRKKFYC